MNKIHSGILAIVMSIFLIQAIDPPYERNSGAFLQKVDIKKIAFTTNTNSKKHLQNEPFVNSRPQQIFNKNSKTKGDDASRTTFIISPYESTSPDIINKFLKHKGKTEYEKLLGSDLVKPLLKLYQTETLTNVTRIEKISKEDNVDDLRTLTGEELDLLLRNQHLYQQLPDNHQQTRRDDNFETNNDQEHIGEILPNNYEEPTQQFSTETRRNDYFNSNNFRQGNYKKNYDLEEFRYRKPIKFSFHPEFDPTLYDATTEDTGSYRHNFYETEESRKHFARHTRFTFPVNDNYRFPKRQRGYRDLFTDGREARYENSGPPQWSTPWSGSRRPRVIFPSDLVAFREPNQEEPDYLAGDSNLQDIQQTDTRDRGLCVF